MREHADGLTRARVQRAIRAGSVSVNGVVAVAPSSRVMPPDTVEANLPDAVDQVGHDGATDAAKINVLYADDQLLVVDKPAGMAVHHGQGRDTGTLVDALIPDFPKLAELEPRDRPGIVHRIDLDTSGLLTVALTRESTESLAAAIRERRMTRRYIALVAGHPERGAATIDGPIGRHPSNPTRQAIDPYGRPARTRYALIQRGEVNGHPVSLLHLQLETGRMHQIRVHLQHIGHPVIGDHTYKGTNSVMGLNRQFLHAHELEFQHPVTSESLCFNSDLPLDLQTFLDQCKPGTATN